MSKPKIKGQTWRSDLRKYGIIYLNDPLSIKDIAFSSNTIVCTRCSKMKSTFDGFGTPKDFYVSNHNLRFYKWCEMNGVDQYAILSDMYGLYLWNEKKEFYDIHPSSLKDDDFRRLSKNIKSKMRQNKWSSFLFWNSSPIMSIPYFYMMLLTDFKIYYITKLYNLKGGVRRFGL